MPHENQHEAKATSSPPLSAGWIENETILILQKECIPMDSAIRQLLLEHDYKIRAQTVLNLTPERAAIFIQHNINKREEAVGTLRS